MPSSFQDSRECLNDAHKSTKVPMCPPCGILVLAFSVFCLAANVAGPTAAAFACLVVAAGG
eukprot:905393-Amphidinium_carterae.1